ncbi:MAG TPA: CoA transferase [Bacillota bacterium]
MSGPLAGLKVLDLTRVLAGPYCTMVLADLGAEVVKIEHPDGGDHARRNGPFFEGPDGTRLSSYFASLNRGKRSITLNLQDPRGKDLFLRMVARADAVVENFKAGTMRRLGLGYDTLAQVNPRIIYAACSGFGQESPYADRPAYDVIVQAMAGTMSINGTPESGPTRVGFSVADIAAGLFTALAILAALHERERSGRGQWIDVAMMDCQAALLENAFARYFASGQVPEPIGSRHPVRTPFQTFNTRDGQLAVAVGTERQWQALCRVLGREDLIADPRFAANADRTRNHAQLESILAEIFAGDTAAVWEVRLLAAGVPAGQVRRIDQVAADPHLSQRRVLIDVPHAGVGPVRLVGHPVRYGRSAAGPAGPAPALGDHTEEVLRSWVGAGADEVAELRAQGVV